YLFSLKIQALGKWSAVDTVDVIALPLYNSSTRFTYTVPDTEIVTSLHLVGEFNQWKVNESCRFEQNGDSWWLDLALDPGEYEYKLVRNESDWILDHFNSKKVSDGWQGFNSLKIVPPVKIPPPAVWLVRQSGHHQLRATSAIGQIHWYEDVRNSVSLPMPTQNFLDLPKNLPNGYYTFFALSEQDGLYSVPRKMNVTVNSGGIQVRDANQVPQWAENAVIYEVYLRQFTPDGTIAGLREKLPYLHQLGVNCIWLMPIFESPQEHGYGPVNFFQINPEYGNNRELELLIQAAHRLDMKIMLDFIANHSADQHRHFLSAYTNPQSVFRDWYQWHSPSLLPDKLSYAYHNDWDSLPNLNYDNPNVWHFMIAVARHWAAAGVDGFRCDVAWGVPHLFWKTFRREIKREYPDLLLLNEVLPRSPDYHDFEFDMSYDTDFYGNLLDVMNGRKPVSAIELGLRKSINNYPHGALSLRYLENHDLDRFIATNNYLKTKLAATLLLTVPGTPLIYYGQELGLREIRGAMPWESSENGLLRFYQRLLNLRRQTPALQSGEWLHVDSGLSDVLAYVRQKDEQRILLLFNFSEETQHVLLDSFQL
ncbi:DUF3459 domain-containing protein, partial [bacterium]|nr:DUF3459 domain-containing protein [bacterium]